MVQARLLFSIALHGRHEIQEAQKMLTQSTQLALHLGMHESSFFANESPLEEESWRRTWWEIYVVNGYMSAIWRKSGFNIGKTFSDLPLPCEEAAYLSGSSPTETISLGEFDARLYADEERRFSSFCYRIEAVRILARVLDLNGAQDVQWAHNEVQSVDNALAAWSHHLPPEKVEIINTLGQVDEIMFQAHMIIQYASIYLHFPRSNLQHTIAANADITCGRRDSHVSPTSTPHMHAIKATEASKQLTNLASLRLPVENHSPFFINGLALSGVVQLSACSLHTCDCFHQHRDRVLLILGVLKSMGRIWPFSQLVLQQVKKVAAKVFDIFVQAPMPLPQVSNSASTEQGEMSMGHSSSWLDTLDIQTLQGMMNFDTEMEYTGPI
ncbi:hypothetical protein EJ08DRAFT_588879 [Tothia fuscella]|uniref:Xylanolytic transcriptional activator regulatory domain-containing protein n=1 Tax=Tothia fuscella TaxID=1048955 RepID=A0A9P4NRX2_9PEZI|nr:hypothetical protein EJ08DRAFT_588879 [Tothia fuscella]